MMSTRGVGGLDLSTSAIGTLGSIVGGCLIAYQVFVYPRLIKRAKPLQLWVYCSSLIVACSVAIPFIPTMLPIQVTEGAAAILQVQTNSSSSSSSSSPLPASAGTTVDSSAALVAATAFRGIQMAMDMTIFTSSFLAINNSCDSSQRGMVNGLGMTVASFTKAIGPLIGHNLPYFLHSPRSFFHRFWIQSLNLLQAGACLLGQLARGRRWAAPSASTSPSSSVLFFGYCKACTFSA